ncbi:MAG: hypothetical protein QXK24_06560 [Ignisphaera sp.]
MASGNELSEYNRTHILKYCREKCIDEGYHGKALNDCIEECLKKYRK